MRSPLSAAALVLACCAARLGAQEAPPTAPPPVIRGGVELVRVDVVVTDRDGRHVPDLRAEEFSIEEDGRPRAVAALRYVTRAGAAEPSVASGPASALEPEAPAATEPRSMAIVMDDMTFSSESRVRVQRVVRHVIRELATPDTPILIMRTGGGPNAIQDFTFDKSLQEAVIAHLRLGPVGGGGRQGDTMEKEQRIQLTLQMLRGVQRLVEELEEKRPGRKTVLLVSEGLAGDEESGRVKDALRRLTDTANRGNVSISTINPSGLQTNGFTASDFFDQGPTFDSAALRESLSAGPAAAAARRRDLRSGPDQLAKDTGGLALGGNDLMGAAERVWNDQDGYYLIGYEPESASVSSPDGEAMEHKISVRVKRKGLTVRSRRVYYTQAAEPDAAP